MLTKALGTGVVFHADMRALARGPWLEAALRSVTQSNAGALSILRAFGVDAATDVTGFGLIGHAYETASRSGVRIRLEADRFVPLAGALEVARAGERTGGDPRTRAFVGERVSVDGVPDEFVALAFDPQTSGGLLISLSESDAAALESALPEAYRIGRVIGRQEQPIRLI